MKDMFYTYVISCTDPKLNKNIFYVGYTEDLKNRFQEHQAGEVKTTKKYSNIRLVYYESCINEKDARKREKELKSGFGRGYLKRRLKNFLNELN